MSAALAVVGGVEATTVACDPDLVVGVPAGVVVEEVAAAEWTA